LDAEVEMKINLLKKMCLSRNKLVIWVSVNESSFHFINVLLVNLKVMYMLRARERYSFKTFSIPVAGTSLFYWMFDKIFIFGWQTLRKT
jgi:hypothetical protein